MASATPANSDAPAANPHQQQQQQQQQPPPQQSTPPPPPQQQLTLFVTFHVDPARIDEWKAAHRPVWAALAAEPRCVLFDVFEDPSRPGTLRLVEVWGHGATRAWFETVQFHKPYYAELWVRSRPTWTAEPEVEFFERMASDGSSISRGAERVKGPGLYRRGYLEGSREIQEE